MAESDYYVRYQEQVFREADEARKLLADRWRESWKVYNNDFDYSKKAGWQTKLRWSRFAGTVETFAAVLKRAMVEARTWWIAEGMDQEGKDRAPLVKRLVDLWLRLANFIVIFTDGLKLGAIADMIVLKGSWPQWEEEDVTLQETGGELAGLGAPVPAPKVTTQKRAGLKIELLDPFKVWLDPTGRNRYVIEESTTDLDELQTFARLNPDAWDKEAIDKMAAAAQTAQADYDERRRQGLTTSEPPPWRKPVKLRTFWGDVVNEEDFTVERNVTFAVANESELVGKVRPIPFWHKILDRRLPNKRGPLVWGFPFRIPQTPYGKGLGRDNLDLAVVRTEFDNAIADQTIFAGITAFEVDKELIDDPEQFKDGVYPGKTFLKREGANGRAMIEPRQLGQVNPMLLNVAGYFDREYQNSTGVTGYIEPSTPARQTPTLGEYQGRQSQSLGYLDMIARNLEDQLLEPFLSMVFWLIIQYMDDFTIPEVVDVLGSEALLLASMSDTQRFAFLKANVRFSARGMSVVLAQQQELQKIGMILQGLPLLQPLIPDIAQRLNGDAILRKIVEGAQWDPDEMLRAPQQTAIEQEALAGGPQIPPSAPTNVTPPGIQPGLLPGGIQ